MYTPPTDKLLHFAMGCMCTLAGLAAGLLARMLGASASPAWCGLFACFLAGVLREVWNKRRGGLFDWRDISATTGGALPVLGAFWLGNSR